jgi:hypothetical protein
MKRFKKLSDFSQSLNEDNLSGLANAHPWGEIEKMGTKLVKGQPIQLGSLLFGTGIDKIDVNSTAFQDAVQIVRWLYIQRKSTQTPKQGTLIIRGSASAVGSSSGYDNFALAQRRAKNLFNALQVWFDKNHPKTVISPVETDQELDWIGIEKYIKIIQEAVVGSATRKGSPEALREQCVYLIWVPLNQQQDYQFDLVQPIDNVGVVLPQPPTQVLKPVNPDPGTEMARCGCCGRPFTKEDKYSWVMQRYLWSLNELKNGWLKTKMGDTVYSWLIGMSKK